MVAQHSTACCFARDAMGKDVIMVTVILLTPNGNFSLFALLIVKTWKLSHPNFSVKCLFILPFTCDLCIAFVSGILAATTINA